MIDVFGTEIKEVPAVFLSFIPMADHQRRHDHEFIFLKNLHGLFHSLQRNILIKGVQHFLLRVLHPDHKLINPGLLETGHEIRIAHDNIRPALDPEVLA